VSGSPPASDVDGSSQPVHVPVLVAETLEALALAPGLVVVDGTVGAGGHASGIARAIGPDGTLIGLDRDVEILACAREAFAAAKAPGAQARVSLHHLVFSRMREALSQDGFRNCDRVLLDLGVSSLQLDSSRRGFSFMADGPLDMRMDASAQMTAAAWLARVPEPELARVLFEYGGERHSRRIARAICTARQRAPLQRTQQLADVVVRALPPPARRQRIHPATRTFQAVRMAVNDELGELQRGLAAALDCLRPGGRLCVISFHSAEDGMVKRFVREQMQPLWRKPVTAGSREVADNPRARSARLRCGVREEGSR
jgi:16S rRNA (cytosine1402-N4)-methyltransferase